jgi:hypothetical protein
MIANNHGYENGWAKQIFGRAVKAEYPTHTKIL